MSEKTWPCDWGLEPCANPALPRNRKCAKHSAQISFEARLNNTFFNGADLYAMSQRWRARANEASDPESVATYLECADDLDRMVPVLRERMSPPHPERNGET